MRVCYFGTYDTFQSRNSLLIQALRAVGVDVVECHVPLWQDTDDKIRAVSGGWRSFELWRRLARAYTTLLLKAVRLIPGCDVVVVGYAGHLDLFLAWPLTRTAGAPLVFDAFNSLTETLVDDRRLVRRNSIFARLLHCIDVATGRLADAVLVDTEAHRQYFRQAFGVPLEKLHVVPAGAAPMYGEWKIENGIGEMGNGQRRPKSIVHSLPSIFRILYFGQYIPLHGVDVIVDAARLLVGQNIEFHLVGRGQMYRAAVERARGLTNVTFHHTWLPPAELLARHILSADVCLGVFDPGPKAGRVIPQKVYVALAAGKPVITGDSPAARELLTDGLNALLVPRGDPEALAAAVRRLSGDAALRERLGKEGRRLFQSRFRSDDVGVMMRSLLQGVLAQHRGRTPVRPQTPYSRAP